MPTDAQLKEHGLTREQYNERNKLWRTLMSELPRETQSKIKEDPHCPEGLLLVAQVETAFARP